MGKLATHTHTLTAPGRKGGGSYQVTTENVEVIPRGDGLIVRPDPVFLKGWKHNEEDLQAARDQGYLRGAEEGSAKAQAHREEMVRSLLLEKEGLLRAREQDAKDLQLASDVLSGTQDCWRLARARCWVYAVLAVLASGAAVWGWVR